MFFISLLITSVFANFDGLNRDILLHTPIASYSRPCCNFSSSIFTDLFNVTKLTSIDRLEKHKFASGKDEYGITYTCRGGFIDIAHLRDTADWTAHLIYILPTVLGKGVEFPIRQEGGGTKKIYFPKLNAEELKAIDLTKTVELAQNLAFEIALWHEIITGFEVHVTTQFAKETGSSFSVEDNYSNALGIYIGAMAVLSDKPYEDAVTEELNILLKELHAVNYETTELAYDLLKNIWWKKGIIPAKTDVFKKNMQSFGMIQPILHPNAIEFGCNEKPFAIHSIENSDLNKYFHFTIQPNHESQEKIDLATGRSNAIVETSDFPKLIEVVRNRFLEYLPKSAIEP